MFRAFFLSFTKYDLLSPPKFIGFKNYVNLFRSGAFVNSLKVTIVYVFGTVIPVWFLSFFVAYLINEVRFAPGFWRTALFIPTVLPLVAVTLVWKLFFHYQGVINMSIRTLGGNLIPWLSNSDYAPLALIITSWWHATSYYMILFLAGIQAIPVVYYEAGALDGVTRWQRLRYITLPLMKPVILLVVVLSIFKGFTTFALQHVMTGGGPESATEIVTLLIYKKAFSFLDMGSACATSVLYIFIILTIGLLHLRVLRGSDSGE